MPLGFCAGPVTADHSCGVDENAASDDSGTLLAVHLLRPPCPVGFQHGVLGIAQKRHRQVVFLDEFAVRVDRIGAYSQDHRVEGNEIPYEL